MCDLQENHELEGKVKMPITTRLNFIVLPFIALSIVVLTLSLPLMEQTHIHVEIAQNKISDVWVETPRVSLISTIISPSKKIGINTINVTIPKTGESFQLKDIPDGEYVIVWVNNGVPAKGDYMIEVRLIQNDVIIDTFDLEVSF